jgi:hypothetical protein
MGVAVHQAGQRDAPRGVERAGIIGVVEQPGGLARKVPHRARGGEPTVPDPDVGVADGSEGIRHVPARIDELREAVDEHLVVPGRAPLRRRHA